MTEFQIQNEIERLERECDAIIDQRKKNTNEDVENELFLKHKMLQNEIADLKWMLKSDDEKQAYRKAVLNMSQKWSTMKGSAQSEENLYLDKVVMIYELASELVSMEDLPEGLKEKLELLIREINSKRV